MVRSRLSYKLYPLYGVYLLQKAKTLLHSDGRTKIEFTPKGSILTVENVTIEDAGIFKCVANNGVPRVKPIVIEKNIYLLVNRKLKCADDLIAKTNNYR